MSSEKSIKIQWQTGALSVEPAALLQLGRDSQKPFGSFGAILTF
jgi:hypothetical protein